MSQNLKTALKLLSDFEAFINNRSIFLLVGPRGAFSKILDWHFRIWKKKYKRLTEKNKLSEWSVYNEIFRTLDSILQKIEARALKEGQSSAFFRTFKEHAEKYKRQFVESEGKNKKYYYIESLLNLFYQVFFENIENSPEKYNIWEYYFPEEWKITKNNLANKENTISRTSLNNFLNWARERICRAREGFDRDLDDISRNLFPEVNPILWAKILIFVFSPYGENRIKSVVERPWNFGFVGRIYPGYPENSEGKFRKKINEVVSSTTKREVNNTFELAFLLFPKDFSKKNLQKYIADLKKLRYDKDSKEEGKRLRLLAIFEKMLKYKNNT